jgi:hypothetical protein
MFLLADIEAAVFLPSVQTVSLILLIGSLVLGIINARKYPKISLFIYPLLTWVFHAVVFYCFVLYNTFVETALDDIIINGWSSGLRFHLVLLIFAYFIIMLKWGKKWIQ